MQSAAALSIQRRTTRSLTERKPDRTEIFGASSVFCSSMFLLPPDSTHTAAPLSTVVIFLCCICLATDLVSPDSLAFTMSSLSMCVAFQYLVLILRNQNSFLSCQQPELRSRQPQSSKRIEPPQNFSGNHPYKALLSTQWTLLVFGELMLAKDTLKVKKTFTQLS